MSRRPTTSAYYAMRDRMAKRDKARKAEEKAKEEKYYSWLINGNK